MSNNLYIKNKKLTLNSSQNVCQYVDCNNSKLITLIGEFHDDIFKCGKDSMNISEYCKNRLENNKKCIVFLEYHNNINHIPDNINSQPIRQLSSLSRKYGKRISGWDTRWKYLNKNGYQGQNTLYYENFKKVGLTKEDIEKKFLLPCEEILNKLNSNKYNKKSLKIIKEYEIKLKNIIRKITINSNDLQYKLKDLWMYAADYEILCKILKNYNNVNEIIVVAGKYHVDNLCPALKHLEKIHSSNINKEKKCASIFIPTTIDELCKIKKI